ncbi:uncharacterized protein LOC131168022 [Malania oleifera]|uniref:uncharacterized protein LOC131168022 n=1 Tax=Malania oleifera TaxID=397392 RepID=UPI0025AE3295|nr:uncharacterized protein LOC131168022 [Malania oleifera]
MLDLQYFSYSKSSLFSTVTFAAVFIVVISAASFISNISLYSSAFRVKRNLDSACEPLLLRIEGVNTEAHREVQKPLISPVTVTGEEGIGQLRNKLQELEILKWHGLAPKFDHRLREFFNGGCSLRFFMTWISPAKSFGRREFFTVESLFKAHPQGCLVILSKTLDTGRGRAMLEPLVGKGFRLMAATPNLSFLLKNTSAEAWFEEISSGRKEPGEIPLAQNLSNLLRLAILYKYGGIYLDTDFIVLRDFSGLRNSIGAQSVNVAGNWTRLNNAVLVFEKNHPLLYQFIEEFASTFDGNRWGHNGPYLVSRVVERTARRLPAEYSVRVLPPMAFYPVDWTRVGSYFRQPHSRFDSKWVEAKLVQLSLESYGVHLWNRETRNTRIEEGSVMGRLVSSHCILCREIYSL